MFPVLLGTPPYLTGSKKNNLKQKKTNCYIVVYKNYITGIMEQQL